MNQADINELDDNAEELIREIEALELEQAHLPSLIHEKRLVLNGLTELLEIKGISM